LRTMAKEGFVIPPRDIAPGLYDLTIAQCHSAGFAPRITQHARQMQTVIGLVASGMGIALVPASVRNLKRPGVRYRTMRGSAALVELGVLSRREDRNPIAMRFSAVLHSVADDGSR